MIKEYIKNSIDTKQKILNNEKMIEDIELISKTMIQTLQSDKKILFVGNGGSASDCDHLATEFVSKFFKDRHALNALSLTSNNALITALSNDFGYEKVFSRQIEAIAKEGDILFALSTSGKSKNVIEAIKAAKKQKLTVIGFFGAEPAEMNGICDILIKIPSTETPIIQESHVMLGHLICKIVEESLSK